MESISNKDKNIFGKQLSFEQIYIQYIKPVYIVTYSILKNKEDAEDVTHEVFLEYFQIQNKEKIRDVKSYLLRMAHNKALNFIRKRSKEIPVEDFSLLCISKEENKDKQSYMTARLLKAIEKLSDEEREIVILHTNAKLKFKQIALVMNLSLPAVYRRYKKAIAKLQKELIRRELNE